MSTKSKQKQIEEYLKNHNSLTSFKAFSLFNCTRLSAVIYNMKKKGYNIHTDYIKKKDGHKYARYYIKYWGFL